MMKKTVPTFEEHKSEYINEKEEDVLDQISSEDSSMNKMLVQLVLICFVGMILLFFVFQSFTNNKNIEDEDLARGVVFELNEENLELIEDIKDIETSVISMVDEADINTINQGTMAFIRKDRYGYNVSGMSRFIWSRFAGTMDQEAGIYRADHVEEVLSINSFVDGMDTFKNPGNDFDIDFKHLVTVIDLELTHVSEVEYEDEYYDYLFSWAGDLETFFIDMGKYSYENPDLTEEDLYAYARQTIGSLEQSYFSREDLLADIDGVNIAKLMTDEELLLSEAINSYYGDGLFATRYTQFIESFGGEDLFRDKVTNLMNEEVEAYYIEDTEFITYYENVIGLKQLMGLFMNRSQYTVTSEMEDAAVVAFIDIIIESYGIEAFENQLGLVEADKEIE